MSNIGTLSNDVLNVVQLSSYNISVWKENNIECINASINFIQNDSRFTQCEVKILLGFKPTIKLET